MKSLLPAILTLIALILFTACDPYREPGNVTVVAPPAAGSQQDQTTPVVVAPVQQVVTPALVQAPVSPPAYNPQPSPTFCIPHELRTDWAAAIPSSPFGALYSFLIYNPYPNRSADPMCQVSQAVTLNGHILIACAVNTPAGKLQPAFNTFGAFDWQPVDRIWIQDALNHEALLDGIVTPTEMSIGIAPIDANPVFSQNTVMKNAVDASSSKDVLMIDIDTSAVNFTGYCQ